MLINYTLSHFACIYLSSIVILEYPENTVAINGERIVWLCKAKGSDVIQFLVNGTFASEQTIQDKGFVQGFIDNIDSTTKQRNLTVTALTQYNNTEIQCVAIDNNQPSMPIHSDIALLLIQGMEDLS